MNNILTTLNIVFFPIYYAWLCKIKKEKKTKKKSECGSYTFANCESSVYANTYKYTTFMNNLAQHTFWKPNFLFFFSQMKVLVSWFVDNIYNLQKSFIMSCIIMVSHVFFFVYAHCNENFIRFLKGISYYTFFFI